MPETTTEKINRLRKEITTLYNIYTPTTKQMSEIGEIHAEFKNYLEDIECTRAVLISDYLEKELKILRVWKMEKPKIILPTNS